MKSAKGSWLLPLGPLSHRRIKGLQSLSVLAPEGTETVEQEIEAEPSSHRRPLRPDLAEQAVHILPGSFD
jgi:hypothetical protein